MHPTTSGKNNDVQGKSQRPPLAPQSSIRNMTPKLYSDSAHGSNQRGSSSPRAQRESKVQANKAMKDSVKNTRGIQIVKVGVGEDGLYKPCSKPCCQHLGVVEIIDKSCKDGDTSVMCAFCMFAENPPGNFPTGWEWSFDDAGPTDTRKSFVDILCDTDAFQRIAVASRNSSPHWKAHPLLSTSCCAFLHSKPRTFGDFHPPREGRLDGVKCGDIIYKGKKKKKDPIFEVSTRESICMFELPRKNAHTAVSFCFRTCYSDAGKKRSCYFAGYTCAQAL